MNTRLFLPLAWGVLVGLGIFQAVANAAEPITYCSTAGKLVARKFAAASERWKKELVVFANSPPVAAKADELLSTLIERKSPLVDSWMTKNSLYGKPEADIVRAWRRYFAESQLSSYPTRDEAMNKEISRFAKKLGKSVFERADRTRFQKLFAESKAGALAVLKKMPGAEKAAARVAAIRLFWIDEIETAVSPKSPLEFFEWGVAYDPVPNVINVGLEALKYPNDSTLFAVFAHEIGHAFDSCRWVAFFEGAENPFAKVQACLRESASVGALVRDDSQLEAVAKRESLGAQFVEMMKLNPTCTKAQYPPAGVQADQLPESFADWFAAEVTAASAHARRGLRADLCEAKELRAGSSYPANSARLERIYLAQPLLRKKLGIKTPSEATYCDPVAAKSTAVSNTN